MAVAAFPSDHVDFVGHGFGHGRGMGQYGALGYALGGMAYGDILQHYYVRLKARLDVSAYEPWVNDVKAGRENTHRYRTVEPLPAATLELTGVARGLHHAIEREERRYFELAHL